MRNTATLVSAIVLAVTAASAAAQTPPTSSVAAPKMKGVWEPVNYTEDLALNDVFFVTPDIGYVGGASGTILKTTDSGATWTAQLGGDPQSQERAIRHLRFVSENVGWATQVANTTNLFATRDGETWDQVGTIAEHYTDLAFTSESDGVYATSGDVHQTHDGGRTWKKVYTCQAKVEVDGLPRTIECEIPKLFFVSPSVGFSIGYKVGINVAVVLKTEDGGSSWNVISTIAGDSASGGGLFFLDATTGYLTLYSGKSYRTSDGGLTWTGMPATSLGRNIRFADPAVGWSFQDPCFGWGCENAKLSYTVDGGRRWSSRSFPLPAPVKAFNFPRRDVAYVIGDHGMIYRYRSLPESSPAAPKAIAAIAMPALDNAVLAQIQQLESRLGKIDAAVAAAEGSGSAGGDWSDAAVDQQLAQLQTTVDSVATGVPALGSKHRNLNLVMFGLQLLGDLTGQGNGLKEAFTSLQQSKDLGTASAALQNLHGTLDSMKTSVQSFQTARKPGG